jgi:catechol 2,3-dioxygenase-like lactoylglutathione lyase family enzyme
MPALLCRDPWNGAGQQQRPLRREIRKPKDQHSQKKGGISARARNVTYGSQDICLIAEGDFGDIKAELEDKGYPIELGIVPRTGACGPIDSIYLRDADENLVEISVYRR